MGNANIHTITTARPYKLHFDLEDWEGDTVYAEYSTFSVASEADGFRLSVSGYSGTAGDSMTATTSNDGMRFSAPDRDQDLWENHCGSTFSSGWWYSVCSRSYLNNPYQSCSSCGTVRGIRGIVWYNWKRSHYSLKATSMKLKPV